MPRSARSEASVLIQEARAMELLANEIEIPVEQTERYWSASADLINVVTDIETFAVQNPDAAADDAQLLQLRHRLRRIGARLAELALD